jgi:antitoxin (DNA-binding transcriptional repressor) of toxin-antitoxin stability system
MKTVKVSELKTHLSKYLRQAARGAQIVVKDRDEPIAQLGPLDRRVLPWRERLARDGRLRRGTQDWSSLRISPVTRRVDIQASLDAVREEPHEARMRR